MIIKKIFRNYKNKDKIKKFKSFRVFIKYKDGEKTQEFYSDPIKYNFFIKMVEQNVMGTKCRKAEEKDFSEYLEDLEYKMKNPEINPYFYINIDGTKVELDSKKIIEGKIIYE